MVLVYVNLINPPKDKHPPFFMCEKCWDKSERRFMLIKHEDPREGHSHPKWWVEGEEATMEKKVGPKRGILPPEMVGGRRGGNDGEEGGEGQRA
nr:hypothetical protein [Tanacetum cinerariifolium]